MLLALVLCPLAFAVLAFALPSDKQRPWVLPIAGAAHLALVMLAWHAGSTVAAGGWLVLDALGRLVLTLVSGLFFLCSIYARGYLALRLPHKNRIFTASLLAFLATMTLVTLSHHLGLMWVAVEATTLASAPLIYFDRNSRSLEAVFKYLLIGSVGIALALLGSFFLAYAALHAGLGTSLRFEDLVREAPHLSRPWLHSAFILLVIGYGTKMGLAPTHTWKPDAYGEAPGLVGALLAGAFTSCAFLALLRFYQVLAAAGEADFAREFFVGIGLLSMAVAGAFVVRQRDYKRMLAYSSVEHMGILVLGIGVGGAATWGALLHVVNNGLTKGVLFLAAGNLHRAYGYTRTIDDVSGALKRVPASAALLLAGFFAVTGSPPFAPFLSEFTIVRAAFVEGHWLVGAGFLVLLAVIFVGMGVTVLSVVQGPAPRAAGPVPDVGRETFSTIAPPLGLMALVVVLGVWIPAPLDRLLHDAAGLLSVTPGVKP